MSSPKALQSSRINSGDPFGKEGGEMEFEEQPTVG